MVVIRDCLGRGDKEMLVPGYKVLVGLKCSRGQLCITITINNSVALQNGPVIDVPSHFLQTASDKNYTVVDWSRKPL